ncbi:hypothetical protein C7293_02900 [filamentous cyanobacterium CCT1]|nr:hypothetical protein C7293_02900 [filamentous cyanobacterium CCT1]PSN77898.1 hypothetical protein C8B47_19675 [filamentous cyanobacterium CCP4]
MTPSSRHIHPLAVPLPITTAARETAAAFAREQANPAKAEAVRLNTLAVWVTHDYCRMMNIPADLASSDSWNPLIRLTTDVADLRLPDLGQLECRPLLDGETACSVPPDVWDLRVGYVVVAIAPDFQTAQLLGFTPRVQGETLPLSQLQAPEALLDHLHALREASSPAAAVGGVVVNLGQWLNGVFEQGWQTVEALLAPPSDPAFSFRYGVQDGPTEPPEGGLVADISRAKRVDLALRLGPQQVVLLVDLQAEPSGTRQVSLQVHGAGQSAYVPPGLELTVLESDGTAFMQAQARDADNFIQLQFSGQPGERFRVQIQLDAATYGEDFVI